MASICEPVILAGGSAQPTGRKSRAPDLKKPGFDRKPRSYFVIHLTAGIIGEADSILSMTGASLAPEKPVRRILDRADPLATIAAMR